MLDEQATHLGRTFDYLVPQSMAQKAVPGARVRVPFGRQYLNGFIWGRGHSSDVEPSALKYLKAVQTNGALLDAPMRRDIEQIAAHFGGTVANILRVAVPPRVAYVDNEHAKFRRRMRWGERLQRADETQTARIRRQYRGADDLIAAVETANWRWDGAGGGDAAFASTASTDSDTESRMPSPCTQAPRIIWDSLPGTDTWAWDVAWVALHALMAGRPVVIVLPDERHVAQVQRAMTAWGLRRFDRCTVRGAATARHASNISNVANAQGAANARRTVDAAADAPAPATEAAGPETADSAQTAQTVQTAQAAQGVQIDQAPQASQVWQGDFAVLLGSSPQADRYRSFKALAAGAVRCAIGTRSAMYTPTGENALFVLVDDMVYQNADGFMPYANARGVLEVRARAHHGALIVAGHCRSAQSQWDADHGALEVHGTAEAIRDMLPRMVWLDREELESRLDPTAGSRIPTTAVTMLSHALEHGPVLLSLPSDASTDALACATCHARARCARCTGPLMRDAEDPNRLVCGWCGAPAGEWTCPECGGTRVRGVRVGSATTVEQAAGLFGSVPVIVSTQVRGIVGRIDASPRIVIATPWCEPFVDGGTYQAVALLDAWQSRFRPGLDARIDTLLAWMHVVSLCAPDSDDDAGDGGTDGGCAILIGDGLPDVWESLEAWDPRILARDEVAERTQACFPPAVTVADVWGNRDAVLRTLRQIGAIGGDMATIAPPADAHGAESADEPAGPEHAGPEHLAESAEQSEAAEAARALQAFLAGTPSVAASAAKPQAAASQAAPSQKAPPRAMPSHAVPSVQSAPSVSFESSVPAAPSMPSVLGPIPMGPPETVVERTLDGMDDRVRAVVRVPNDRADELAARLRAAAATHAASGYRVELRFQMYPKDLT